MGTEACVNLEVFLLSTAFEHGLHYADSNNSIDWRQEECIVQIKLSRTGMRGWLKLSRSDSAAELAVVYMNSIQASRGGIR